MNRDFVKFVEWTKKEVSPFTKCYRNFKEGYVPVEFYVYIPESDRSKTTILGLDGVTDLSKQTGTKIYPFVKILVDTERFKAGDIAAMPDYLSEVRENPDYINAKEQYGNDTQYKAHVDDIPKQIVTLFNQLGNQNFMFNKFKDQKEEVDHFTFTVLEKLILCEVDIDEMERLYKA